MIKVGNLVRQTINVRDSFPWLVLEERDGDIYIVSCRNGNKIWIEERVARKWYEVVA